jgi:hypothetical protein
MSGGWFDKHPWLTASLALLFSLSNAYQALYIRPDSLWSIVDWILALVFWLSWVC